MAGFLNEVKAVFMSDIQKKVLQERFDEAISVEIERIAQKTVESMKQELLKEIHDGHYYQKSTGKIVFGELNFGENGLLHWERSTWELCQKMKEQGLLQQYPDDIKEHGLHLNAWLNPIMTTETKSKLEVTGILFWKKARRVHYQVPAIEYRYRLGNFGLIYAKRVKELAEEENIDIIGFDLNEVGYVSLDQAYILQEVPYNKREKSAEIESVRFSLTVPD